MLGFLKGFLTGGKITLAALIAVMVVIELISKAMGGPPVPWWSPPTACFIAALLSFSLCKRIFSRMSEQEKIGDSWLMEHHLSFIPFIFHPPIYFGLGVYSLYSTFLN
ncbi:MAG: hypothetical protein QM496_14335 [Verrucomicrobiota bacterium]